MTDAELEADIEACRQQALRENDEFLQREVFAVMAHLIAQRSPERVREMEAEQGLLA